MKFASLFLCGAAMAAAAVYLEPNRGQLHSQAGFLARTPAGTLAAGPAAMEVRRRDGSTAVIVFEGASTQARALPQQLLPGVSHYIQGRDSAGWIWDVPRYQAVRYEEVYPGIDLVYRASDGGPSQGDMEFDFLLAAGADPSRIRMRVPDIVRLDKSGALAVGNLRLRTPAAWQTIRGQRVPVAVRFAFDRRQRAYFRLGRYDSRWPLTIDPIVQFATFLGGSSGDIGKRVIAGPDGAIYIAGDTTSTDFPASFSADNPLNRPETLWAQTSYVARLKPDASALDWSFFIGGSARQSVFALKQDPFGNNYVLGGTTSPNFPVTAGAWKTSIDPSATDLFLVKLDGQTGHIKASTFLGIALNPNIPDAGALLAIDVAGGVYVGGYRLYGGSFTPSPGAFQTKTESMAFVLRLNSAISAPVYASYWTLGSISAMEVDGGGNLLLGGTAFGSPQSGTAPFPAVNPLPGINQTPAWPGQAYVAQLNPTGSALAFATLIHGGGRDSGVGDLKLAPMAAFM